MLFLRKCVMEIESALPVCFRRSLRALHSAALPLLLISTLVVTSLAADLASAQTPLEARFHSPYSFADANGTESTRILVDHMLPISAWSFGLCHDSTILSVSSAIEGADLAQIRGGNGPDRHDIFIDAEGVRSYVVIDVTGVEVLPPGIGMEVLEIVYLPQPPPLPPLPPLPASTTIEFCETLGVPPVQNIATSGSDTIVSFFEPSTVILTNSSPLYILQIPALVSTYDLTSGYAEFFVRPTLVESTGTGAPVFGFRFGIRHPLGLFDVPLIDIVDPIAEFEAGQGIEFFDSNISPGGITLDVLFSTTVPTTIPFAQEVPLAAIQYVTTTPALQSVGTPVITPLRFDDTFVFQGVPIIGAVLVTPVGGTSTPVQIDGNVILLPDGEFIRGDCNLDGMIDLGDPLSTLQHLFVGGSPDCERACDANDDGLEDIGDAIYLLGFLFSGNPPPSAPNPDCGLDPTPDTQTCETHPSC